MTYRMRFQRHSYIGIGGVPGKDLISTYDKETQKKYFNVMMIALGSMMFVNDLLDLAVMDVYDEMQKVGIYRQRRKQQMKLIMADVDRYEKFIIKQHADMDEYMGERYNAFGDAVAQDQYESFRTVKDEIERLELPNATYLAKLHQAFLIADTACSCVDVWTKRVRAIIPYYAAPYRIDHLRPTDLFNRLRKFVGEEFGSFGDVDEEQEAVKAADNKFIERLVNIEMICKIMEVGQDVDSDYTSVRDLLIQEEKNKELT